MRDYPESVLKAAWARVRRPNCKTIEALRWRKGNNPAEKTAKAKDPQRKIGTLTVNEPQQRQHESLKRTSQPMTENAAIRRVPEMSYQ
jgi:hypothetical protein